MMRAALVILALYAAVVLPGCGVVKCAANTHQCGFN